MQQVMIRINEEWEHRLKEKAAAEHRTEEEIVLEAIRRYLHPAESDPGKTAIQPYEPLRRMIGLIKDGPTEASVRHDWREGDDA